MKQVLLCLLVICGMHSCKSDEPWTEQDRKDFMGGCLKGSSLDMTQKQASAYCNCMWQQIQLRYPSAVSPDFIKKDTALTRLGKDCFMQIKAQP